MGARQRVSSVSDEQVGSTSRSTVFQTNTDKDEMEEVVDEEEEVEGEGEGCARISWFMCAWMDACMCIPKT